jgi:predicted HicB family RNase H-like nuclease
MKEKTFVLRICKEQHQQLRKMAFEKNISMADIVRDSIDRMITIEEETNKIFDKAKTCY